MGEAHKRMEKANEKTGIIAKLDVINPIKGTQKAFEATGRLGKHVN